MFVGLRRSKPTAGGIYSAGQVSATISALRRWERHHSLPFLFVLCHDMHVHRLECRDGFEFFVNVAV